MGGGPRPFCSRELRERRLFVQGRRGGGKGPGKIGGRKEEGNYFAYPKEREKGKKRRSISRHEG